MNEPLNENNFVRLAKALMDRHQIPYERALARLAAMRLRILCDASSMQSVAYQAAMLTAVNCGCRSFLGGVYVSLPHDAPLLLPWPNSVSLRRAVLELGGRPAKVEADFDVTVVLGPAMLSSPEAIRILCDGWRGGVQPADIDSTAFVPGEDFALGGVLAGGLAVEHAFLGACGLANHFLDRPTGMSLWRPDLGWLDQQALGPRLSELPKRLWLIGLGHLGQAYIWSLGLLPYRNPRDTSFMLQDFDLVAPANWIAGLICREQDAGEFKTRVAARWLEARGFKTAITERPYDEHTIRIGEEPFVALCGVDVTAARRLLENAGFDLIVECGVGSSMTDFDRLKIHTLPCGSRKATDLWAATQEVGSQREPSPLIVEALKGQEDCGVLASTLENKAISASFVGTAAGAMVVGELLRALHGGRRCDLLHVHLRSMHNRQTVFGARPYGPEMARTGFVPATGNHLDGNYVAAGEYVLVQTG